MTNVDEAIRIRNEERGDSFRPTILMQRVFAFLKEQDGPVSRNRIAAGVRGNKQYILQAIDCLIADESVEETPGPRGYTVVGLVPVPEPVPGPLGTTEGEPPVPPVPLSIQEPLIGTTSKRGR